MVATRIRLQHMLSHKHVFSSSVFCTAGADVPLRSVGQHKLERQHQAPIAQQLELQRAYELCLANNRSLYLRVAQVCLCGIPVSSSPSQSLTRRQRALRCIFLEVLVMEAEEVLDVDSVEVCLRFGKRLAILTT